jgi:hypothetical protein
MSMNVTFSCPHCHQASRAPIVEGATEVCCSLCRQLIKVPHGAFSQGQIHRCLVCPSTDLFLRKDFPQKLGVGLVIIGFVASSIAWANYMVTTTFAILFVTALVDLVLYVTMGESLTCYRCQAQYSGFRDGAIHGGFDLETHERFRQMAARVKPSGMRVQTEG